jgi:chromosomal replication initiation ATPase DnaA
MVSKPNKIHLKLINQALQAVATVTGYTVDHIISRDRSAGPAQARALAAYLIRKTHPRITLAEIGWSLNRDHTSLFYMFRQAEYKIAISTEFTTHLKLAAEDLHNTINTNEN